MLLEPTQKVQSPDIIVFQNGVLNLVEPDCSRAFVPDNRAVFKHSHAVWSYFDSELWNLATRADLHLMSEIAPGEHFKAVRELVAAEMPEFAKFMKDWFPKDPAAFETVLRWYGYCMTTDTRENKFMFFYGPTRAGKGSVARILHGIIGGSNYAVSNYSAFEDKFQSIGMHDKLVVTMEEVEATPKEHERRMGMLKKFLGGERVVWEQKHARSFEDAFIGKIIMQSNEILAYEDKGRSVTARMIPMEFKESFFSSGVEAPDKVVLAIPGMGSKIATMAALMWYRMRRARIHGAFDLKAEPWSVRECKACKSGESSLLLESHKVLWKYIEEVDQRKFSKDAQGKKEQDVFTGRVIDGKLVRLTRSNLVELTTRVLEAQGRPAKISLNRVLLASIERDFPHCKRVCYRLQKSGKAHYDKIAEDKLQRERGWSSLWLNIHRLKDDFEGIDLEVGTDDTQVLFKANHLR